jgi:hypothetical protein
MEKINLLNSSKRAIMTAAGFMLSAKDALAADLMDSAVNSLDASVQSWAKIAVTIVRAGFVLCVSGGILYYGGLYFLQKKQGHTTQASDSRTTALNVFFVGVGAVILYNIFNAFVAGRIGM